MCKVEFLFILLRGNFILYILYTILCSIQNVLPPQSQTNLVATEASLDFLDTAIRKNTVKHSISQSFVRTEV